MRDLHVYLYQNYATDRVELYIQADVDGKRLVAAPIELDFRLVENGKAASPTIELRRESADGLLREAWREIGRFLGDVTPDSKLAGLTEGMKAHLADLRHLLKLP